MKQSTNSRVRFAMILTHIIGWGIIFGFPFFFINRGGEPIDWIGYIRRSGVPLSFCIVFYLNYFIFTITSLMIKNGDLILNKLAKYKYAFDINSYKHCVDICSKKMNDIVNEI